MNRKTPGDEQALFSGVHLGRQISLIYQTQLSSALKCLDGTRVSGTNVHEARKQLKRARATLRLARAAIGDPHYRREDLALRSASHLLSHLRDNEVVRRTCDRLRKPVSRDVEKADLTPLHNALVRAQKRELNGSSSKALQKARTILEQSEVRSRSWIHSNGWELLQRGIEKTYRKGRQAFHTAQTSPTDEHLHEWRKQAKYSSHQLGAICPLTDRRLRKVEKRFFRLSQLLGDDHDLAMLEHRAHRQTAGLDKTLSAALANQIERRRRKLQKAPFDLGSQLYRERPRAFVRRSTSLH